MCIDPSCGYTTAFNTSDFHSLGNTITPQLSVLLLLLLCSFIP